MGEEWVMVYARAGAVGRCGEVGMAQQRYGSGAKLGRRLRRAGLGGSRGVIMACACLAVVVALGAAAYLSHNAGVLVFRSEQQGTMSQSDQSGDDVSSSDTSSAEGASDASADGTASADAGTGDAADSVAVTVHVDGAVANPGVYTITVSPARAMDAVEAAGGLAADADTTAVNLACVLEDGTKLHVPAVGEDTVSSTEASGATSTSDSSSSTTSSGAVAGTKININIATADELTALPGVGPSTARAIVEDRQHNGKFTSPEDLMRVSGIGEKKFAKMKDYIRV